MRKNIFKIMKMIIAIITCCFLLDITKVYASEVIFDANAVKEKTASKSSLMDVNGIFVFRDEFIEQERLVKQEQKKRLENTEKLVLLSPQKEFDCDRWVNLVLQADTEKYLKDVYNSKRDSNLRWWVYFGTAGICVLCFAVWLEDEKRKKKENAKGEEGNEDNDYGHYAAVRQKF